jgi:hypothetical protein
MQTVTQGRIRQYAQPRERRFEGDKRVNGFCLVIFLLESIARTFKYIKLGATPGEL